MESKKKVFFPHSLGVFYEASTQFLGFSNYGDEYKMMGLSGFGKPLYFEKILEAFFIKFENLDKYKKALIFLSSKKRDKLLNILILNNQNHKFFLKLMKCCGDNDPYFKLNINSTKIICFGYNNTIEDKNLNYDDNKHKMSRREFLQKYKN